METKTITRTNILLTALLLSLISWVATAQTTLVEWNFPNVTDDAIADGGIAANIAKTITTGGSTSAITYAAAGAGSRSALATTWTTGNGTKWWEIEVTTTGYSSITLSSKQRGSNRGPRDFKVQYKIGAGGTWTDAGIDIPAIANNWTSGVITDQAMPAACNNEASVFIRWIMTSNTGTNGTQSVNNAGEGNIDDIIVKGIAVCSGTPTAGTALATPASITCSGTSVLSLSGHTTGSGIAIQWQEFSGGVWIDAVGGSGATTTSYTTPTLSASKNYRARVTCTNSGLSSTTTQITVTVNSPVAGTASASPTAITCSGTTALSLVGHTSSGTTIQWEEFSGGVWINAVGGSGATTASYTSPTLTANKSYRAKVTCTASGVAVNTAQVDVTVNGTPTTGTATAASTALCAGQTTSLTLAGHTATGTTIQWESSVDNATWGNVIGGAGATTTAYATATLSSNIYYRAKVTCTGSGTAVNTASVLIAVTSLGVAATLPFTDNFEGTCVAWSLANGAQTNKWVVNTGAANGGTRGLYITNNAAGSPPPNNYTTTAPSVVHAYRDIEFPAGEDCFQLRFDARVTGETNFDLLAIYLTSTSVTPAPASTVPSGILGVVPRNILGTFITYSIVLPSGLGGTTQRLVFSWINDNVGGTQRPICLDNIQVTVGTPTAPGAATAMAPTGTLSSCIKPTLTWTAPANTGCNRATGYDVYFDADLNGTPELVSSNQTATSYTPDITYIGSTVYRWYVVPRNGAGAAPTPANSTFTTPATPPSNSATAPLSENFDAACVGWTIVNGVQTNRWFNSTFEKQSGTNSMYISNNGTGNNNNYSNTTSTVHFYKDVFFPAGQCYSLTFWYKGLGEGSADFLKVYAAPITTTITAGTQLNAVYQVGQLYNQKAAYTQANIKLSNSVAGTTRRIVFSWTNNGSVNTNPAISVDDIEIVAAALGVPQPANTPSPSLNATLSCATPTLKWQPTPTVDCDGATGYDVYLMNTNGPFVTPVASNVAITSYQPSTLPMGTYYWKVVPRNTAGATNIALCPTWSFTIMSNTATNDLPCNAIALPLVVNLGGDNSCADGTGEAAAPFEWSAGNINSVWYRIVVPASGQLKIRTTLGTLGNTQMQLFTGTCDALTAVAANDDAPSCGASSYLNSEITRTGLTAGSTVFVRVDGTQNSLGTFNIMAIDGTSSFPSSTGQVCEAAVPVCFVSSNIGNPGYQGVGFECDFTSAGCLIAGERGSVWYKIKMAAAGNLNFAIIPNDYDGVSGNETDYDFAIWRTVGAGAVACSAINTGAASAAPLRCNYSALGVTGLTIDGNSPAEYPDYDAAFETEIAAALGDEFILMISNFTNSTSGFSVVFDDASPIEYPNAASITSVTWTGSIDTDWFKPENWGGCSIPSATISAFISPAAANQPIVTAKATCRDLIINLNSTLTLGLGGDIDIHGNYTNDGTFTALPTTTVAFRGATTQTLNGNLINESSFPNLTITKTAGSVVANQDLEVQRNFTTSNVTSVFNGNGKKIGVGGNFLNHTANTTFIPGVGGTLEFNGTADQTYTNSNGTLELENVIVNNTGGALVNVTLNNNLQLSTTGTLTFTEGILKTNANEIIVKNPAVAAVNAGTASSYTWGYLRRFINSTGSYNFPLGIAQNNLAIVNFTGATTIHNLRGRFIPASSFGSPSVAVIAEATGGGACNQPTYINDGGKINTGAWEISAFNSGMGSITGDGTYTITLSPSGFTNAGNYATIAKNGVLEGTRVGCSDPTGGSVTVSRSGLTGFSEFDVVQAADGVLPVTLTSFNAAPSQRSIRLYWTTAQERNNNRFEILRSKQKGSDFEKIGEVRSMGDNNSRQDYQFEDNKVEANIVYYYMLRQVDNDGTPTYTKQVKASIGNVLANKGMVKIYPNPSSTNATLEVLVPESGNIEIRVTDILGKVLSTIEKAANAGFQSIELPTERMRAGAYSVTVIGENLHETLKFTKIE